MTHTIVMTGATRGIGRVAVEHILTHDPDAHLVVLGRGSAAATLAGELSAGGRSVEPLEADLLSMGSLRTALDTLSADLDSGKLPPLRGFVGNAGLQFANATTQSPDGFESTFAVNVLANHLLIRGLERHFAAPARIVITVSDTHFGDLKHNLGMVPGPRWQDPATLAAIGGFADPSSVTAGRTAYSTSKLAMIHLVHEYARRLPAGIDAVSFNPGFVPATGLARDAGPATRFAMQRLLPLLTLTPVATSQEVAGRYLADVVTGRTAAPSGTYVDRAGVVPSSDESYDPQRETELWTAAEDLVGRWLAPAT